MVQQQHSRKTKAAVKSEDNVCKKNKRGSSGAVKYEDSGSKKKRDSSGGAGKPVNLVGKIFVSEEEPKYIKANAKKISIDDPTLVVHWFGDVVDGVVLAALAHQIPAPATGAPALPHFLDISSAEYSLIMPISLFSKISV